MGLPDPLRSRILLVGTAKYDEPQLPDVPEVANNIADFAAVLTDPLLGGFTADQCWIAPPRATAAEMGRSWKRAADEAEDVLLFYFAGHGLLSRPRNELHLGLAGTHYETPAFSAIPFDAIRDACRESHAHSRVVILDCCFSGRAIGDSLAAEEEIVLGQVDVAGTYTLAATNVRSTAGIGGTG